MPPQRCPRRIVQWLRTPSSRMLSRIGVQRVIYGKLQPEALIIRYIERDESLGDRAQSPTLWRDVCLAVDGSGTDNVADPMQHRIGHVEVLQYHFEGAAVVTM